MLGHGGKHRSTSGGTVMLSTLFTHTTTMVAHRLRSHPAVVTQQDDDGACPICDHPFRYMRHACIGPVVMDLR